LDRAVRDPRLLQSVLGEWLSEPKPSVWFEPDEGPARLPTQGLRLHARTRMLYDDHHVFINGESFLARGADARLMRRLADQRALSPRDCEAASADARDLLARWLSDGWLCRVGPS
jgi:50S ribosomal protein L16 3-hydroxylase